MATIPDTGTDALTYQNGQAGLYLDAQETTSGWQTILQDVAHVIQTPRRALFWDAPTGVPTPVQDLYNGSFDDADLVRIGGEWGSAARSQAEGVTGARFTLARGADGKSVSFNARINIGVGTFILSGTAGDVVKILTSGGA